MFIKKFAGYLTTLSLLLILSGCFAAVISEPYPVARPNPVYRRYPSPQPPRCVDWRYDRWGRPYCRYWR